MNTGRRWLAPYVATLCAMLALQMSNLGFSPLLPSIRDAFHMSFAQMGLFAGMYGLLSMLWSVPAGLLAKRFGEKAVLAWGLGTVALGLGALSVAPGFTAAFGARAVWLSGYRFSFVCVMVAVALTCPPSVRGASMGILGAISALASVIGAPLGGVIGRDFGWRSGILAYAGVALAGTLIFVVFYRRDPDVLGVRPDHTSGAPSSAFRSPLVWALAVLSGLAGMGSLSANFFVPSAAQALFHLDQVGASYLISTGFTLAIFVNLLFGFLMDRFNRWKVMAALAGLGALGGIAMTSHDLTVFRIGTALVLALGHAGIQQSYTLAADVLRGRETGNVMGVVSMVAGVFSYLGPQMLGLLRDWSGGFESGWYFIIGAAAATLVLVLALWNYSSSRARVARVGVLLTLLMLMLTPPASPQSVPPSGQYKYPFQNPDIDREARITNILSLMTLEEKIQALGTTTAVPRLGVPDAGGSEGLHGLVQRPLGGLGSQKPVPTTQFAQVVGMAQTWDADLIHKAGEVQAVEARWLYNHQDKYQRRPLIVWGPNTDLARDPRWGRIDESYGEDAFFTGTMAAAFAKGMQGDDPKYWRVASLLKHLLANSNENGRYGSSSDLDERLLREYYSLSFRMAFTDGGASSYMASYNAWNGVPMTVNPILKSIVAGEWGVNGIVSTDAGAVHNMVTKHRYFPGIQQAVAACVKIGVNQFLDGYQDGLRGALESKAITEHDIDAALRGKFRVVLRLGLLDPPALVPYTKTDSEEPWSTDAHKAVALQVARESIVLLKDEGGLLPLDRGNIKSIAVYGSRANRVLLGLYSGEPPYTVSPLDGLRKKLGPAVRINMGAGFMTEIGTAAKASDLAIVFVGNDPTCNRASIIANFDSDNSYCETPSDGMENSDRRSLTLEQEDLIKDVYAANPRTVVVLLSDFPYAIRWTNTHVPAILQMSQNAQEAGTAIADVLFGDYNPAGRLVVTWPQSLDQLPPMRDYNLRHGRTYMYFPGEPLYPFGYGLSYTTFRYSNLKTSRSSMPRDGETSVSVDVENTGDRAGDEVVQLYVTHERSQVTRPSKELRGFQRVSLQPREMKTVRMNLRADSLSYWDEHTGRFVVEEEPIRITVGGSSADPRLFTTVAIAH